MSETRDLWVPCGLALAGIALAAAHFLSAAGDPWIGVAALLLGVVGALACLPLRLRYGQGRVLTFGAGVGLLLMPLVPGLVRSLSGAAGWLIAGLALLLPLRALDERTRLGLLSVAGLLLVLALVSTLGLLPRSNAWLFLAGALFFAWQVRVSRPRPPAPAPVGPRVCVFGGSFDPFHRGHRGLAEAAAARHDRLLVVVAGSPPHKFAGDEGETSDQTPFHHRVAMTRLGVMGLPRTEVLELEGRRDGPSYTIDTLQVIRRSFPEGTTFFLLLGADMLQDFPTWHAWRDITECCQLLVATRPGHDPDPPPELEELGIRPARLAAPFLDVSATRVREALARGEDTGAALAPNVRDYIEEHGLYRSRRA